MLIARNSAGGFDKNFPARRSRDILRKFRVFERRFSAEITSGKRVDEDNPFQMAITMLTLAVVIARQGQRASCSAFHRSRHLHHRLKWRCSCHRGIIVRQTLGNVTASTEIKSRSPRCALHRRDNDTPWLEKFAELERHFGMILGKRSFILKKEKEEYFAIHLLIVYKIVMFVKNTIFFY